MKKLFITALIAIAAASSSFAAPNKVNSNLNDHFTSTFSNAKNVSWKSYSYARFDKVSFVLDNEKVNAFYNREGELLGTSKNMAFDKLPKNAITTITTKYTYPEYQVQECIEFVNSDNEKSYFVSFEKSKESLVLAISETGIVNIFSITKK